VTHPLSHTQLQAPDVALVSVPWAQVQLDPDARLHAPPVPHAAPANGGSIEALDDGTAATDDASGGGEGGEAP
jgi:hypothetical protein